MKRHVCDWLENPSEKCILDDEKCTHNGRANECDKVVETEVTWHVIDDDLTTKFIGKKVTVDLKDDTKVVGRLLDIDHNRNLALRTTDGRCIIRPHGIRTVKKP